MTVLNVPTTGDTAPVQHEHLVATITCHDQPGIVHAVTGAIVAVGGNIIELQQFSSADTGRFFMRVEIDPNGSRNEFESRFAQVAEEFGISWTIDLASRRVKTLVLATTAEHCVQDLLFRERSGLIPIDITGVVANQEVLAPLVSFYEKPFDFLPIGSADDQAAFEARLERLIEADEIELIVLARFMRILSPEFCAKYAGKIINIHHSFLPGFKGANPYRQAHERGVKLIGATAHFVTADLDEGPIIEQNVQRVSHNHSAEELKTIGGDIEARTLSQAVRWFAEHRILLDGQRTIIFE